MPVYFFSELSNGQAISFNPTADHLTFDDAGIAAANVRLTTSGANTRVEVVSGSQAGKHIILLNLAPTQLAGSSGGPTFSNTGFFDASSFALGDQNVGTAGDNNANLLVGTNQGDLLMGFGGADTLQGGNGDDTYIVGTGDVISDSGGIDTVLSDITWTAGNTTGVDHITLTGTGAIGAQGNNSDNRLVGNDAANVINGRAGNDTLIGNGGNDVFDISTGGTTTYGSDSIDGGAGQDAIDFLGNNAVAAVIVDLAAGTASGGGSLVFTGIERVSGGGFGDRLVGDNVANTFYGQGGNDTLAGAQGNDTLHGGAGADNFDFTTLPGGGNVDRILDFAPGADKLRFDSGVFNAIGAEGNFVAGDGRFWAAAGATSGHDANDRIIFNTTTRSLYYDADGNGSGAAQLITTFQGTPSVTATDIVAIGSATGGATEGNDSLTGTNGNDTINGLGGNDTIDGLGGNDLLIGGSGNDLIYSLAGFDTVDGGSGMDTQVMQGGIAGAGIETIILRGYSVEGGADGHGNELDNTIIDEGPGNAYLYGNGGDDTLIGGGGFNVFVFSGNPSGSSDDYGHDVVDGGADFDWLFFENNSAAVVVDFRNGTVTGGSTVDAGVTFANIEGAQGSLHDDLMTAGDGNSAWLHGYGGDDTLRGGAADDVLFGDTGFGHPTIEPGNDSLSGGAGADGLHGEEGHDTLAGGAGNDTLNGGVGNDDFVFDVAAGNANADLVQSFDSGLNRIVLDGNAHAGVGSSGQFAFGDGRFWAAAGANAGHDANDRVVYNTSTGQLWFDADGSGAGAAQLIATLEGAPGVVADDIWVVNGSSGGATEGDDSLTGTAGNDTIDGLGGNDTIEGEGGSDHLIGGAGNDSIVGGLSEDAGEEHDTLVGGAGNDTLDGSQNFSFGTRSADTLDGGLGDDTYFVDLGEDAVADAGGFDTVVARDTSFTLGGGIENLVLSIGLSEFATGIGNELHNQITASWHARLEGLGGNDTMVGSLKADSLFGGEGNDYLYGGGQWDSLDGGAGNDTLDGGADGPDTMTGGAGADRFVAARGANEITDFASGADKMQVDGFVFSSTGPSGDFAAGDQRFHSGVGVTAAHDASDRVIYDSSTGTLYYDEDGTGSAAAFVMSVLQGAPLVTAADITVINGSNDIRGTGGNDSLVGTPGDDQFQGLDGNDTMDGLGGDDWFAMEGIFGADRAYGRDGTDTVSFVNATGSVNASIVGSFASGGGGSVGMFTIENLVGTAFSDTLIGDANANRLEGGEGNDTITGREGDDVLLGNEGDDVFIFNNGGSNYGNDAIDGGNGVDRAEFGSLGRTAAVIDLAAGTVSGGGTGGAGSATLANIENVIGTAYADRITGNSIANDLSGSNGNDTLAGGFGADTLSGGSGNDFFDFTTAPGAVNADRILDFVSGTDDLRFDDAVHVGIGATGGFAAADARFWAAAGATSGHDANDRLVYDTSTGSLYYDADGTGSGASVLVATFQGNPALAATDIAVI